MKFVSMRKFKRLLSHFQKTLLQINLLKSDFVKGTCLKQLLFSLFKLVLLSLIKRSWSIFLIVPIVWIGIGGYFPVVSADESSSVIVRTSLEPERPVVGQQVEFRVDVFVDTWFAKATKFPEIKIDDAIALLPPSASINLNERINGKPYTGQRRTYFIFPQLPGGYVIPSLSLSIFSAHPGSSTENPVSISTPSLNFLALLPSDLATKSDRSILLATPQLQIDTQLKTQKVLDGVALPQLHTGDTLERTIALTATDTLVSMLPAISVTDIQGLSIYPDPPKLTNQFERGEFQARRTERISYVAEQAGHYQLPQQTISWWNTHTNSLETDTIPAVEVWVKPTAKQMIIRLLPWLIGLLTIVGTIIYFRRSLRDFWNHFQQKRQNSEAYRWKLLSRACLNNDAKTAWFQLRAWLASNQQTSTESIVIEKLLNRANNSALTQAVRELEAILFNDRDSTNSSPVWSGKALLQELSLVRKHKLLKMSRDESSRSSLPLLNPIDRRSLNNE